MLDRMYKEYPRGEAPAGLEQLARKILAADGFVFVAGEYNWGVQPGSKNLTDHFLEEWFWRPAAIVSYSAGRLSGVAGGDGVARHALGDGNGGGLSTIAIGPLGQARRRKVTADRRGRCGSRTGVSTLCRRSHVVGGSREGATATQGAALLKLTRHSKQIPKPLSQRVLQRRSTNVRKPAMKILIVLTSHDTLGNTGRKTGSGSRNSSRRTTHSLMRVWP